MSDPLLRRIFNLIYPVGSIYFSVNNVNPSSLFGGTWVAWGSGRVPVGVNSSDSSFNTVEKTGGSKELQSHNHDGSTGLGTTDFMRVVGVAGTSIVANHIVGYSGGAYVDTNGHNFNGANHVHGFTTNNTGSGNSGNLQPYITCFMWKRTA